MPVWGWILIAVAAAAVVAVIVVAGLSRRRSSNLRQQFGPEYDRTIDRRSSRREAEGELQSRVERRERLDIKPLSTAAISSPGGRYRQSSSTIPRTLWRVPIGS
jgi:hypothetical protein